VLIDLHTHSNRSDGTDPVDVLMRHAQQAGLDVIALTDHDTADGWVDGRRAAEELGITQPRVSRLMKGKVEDFSLDMLVTLAGKLGLKPQISFAG